MTGAPSPSGAYRTAAASRLPAVCAPPPAWQRVVAWFSPARAVQWRWYRERAGGRWARLFWREGALYSWTARGWREVPSCPRVAYDGSFTVCGECTAEACKCEVWS